MRSTYHLVPAEAWAASVGDAYVAPTLSTEGFIHCTDGPDEVIATANRYYRDDPRPYLVLVIDLDAVDVPWRIEDPAGIYPHVYGSIPRSAITSVRAARRTTDGTFLGMEAAAEADEVRAPRPDLPARHG